MKCAYDWCDAPGRPYAGGVRCVDHTPAREHGRTEPQSLAERGLRPWWVNADGTVLPLTPLTTSHVHDTRATASGRRVSGERRKRAHAGEAYEAAS